MVPPLASAPPGRARPAGDTWESAQRPPPRRFEPDLVRVVALLLVVVIHATPWPQRAGAAGPFYSGLALWSRSSVPLFVVLSGVLLAPSSERRVNGAAFWGRRLSRTLLPWIPWAVLYFAVEVVFRGLSPSPQGNWDWWAGGAGHLYFLLLIPQLYCLLLIWPRSERGRTVALAIAIAVQLALQLVRVLIRLPPPGNDLTLNFGFELAPFWVGYFALGIWAGPRLRRLSGGLSAWTVCLGAMVAASALLFWAPLGPVARDWGPWVRGTGAFLRPALLPLTASLTALLWLGGRRLADSAVWLRTAVASAGRHALGIYIVHPLALLALGTVLQRLGGPLALEQGLPGSLLPFALLVAFALAVGWAATHFLASFRYSAWTVGEAAEHRPGAPAAPHPLCPGPQPEPVSGVSAPAQPARSAGSI